MIGYFTQTIMKDLRLISGYDVLYGKVKAFVRDELFDKPVGLEDVASKVLQSPKYSDDTKTLAASVLAQSNKKR